MSERKWTKGEWRCSRADMQSFDAGTGAQVSFVYPGDEERITVRTSKPVEDARLIASAPELFEAGELAINAIDNVLSSHEGQAEYEQLKKAFDALEASLFKALGSPQ